MDVHFAAQQGIAFAECVADAEQAQWRIYASADAHALSPALACAIQRIERILRFEEVSHIVEQEGKRFA